MLMRQSRIICFSVALVLSWQTVACQQARRHATRQTELTHSQKRPLPDNAPPALKRVIEGAIEQANQTFYYDPAYVQIDYPNGDVPLERGVCTDVVVRAFRKGDVDLQTEVHEDMRRDFAAYPTKWGLTKPDSNIDHRRVPNLQTYFARRGKSLKPTTNADDYKPGDIVSWDLGGGLDHIGIVTNLWSPESKTYLIAHNIGSGARIENVLFSWHITGHYRYF
jgi:uncharacterized protein YijF (DUF1287 family)